MTKFRTRYEPFVREPILNTKPSMTKREFKEECDINNVLKRYLKTGQLPALIKNNPQYGDFSQAVDYQESLNLVHFAQEQFQNLSASIRERFRNDPYLFLQFATDPQNQKEMVKLGLATKRPPKEEPKAKAEGSSQGAGEPPAKAPKAPKPKEE